MRHSLVSFAALWAALALSVPAQEAVGFKIVVPADHPLTSISHNQLADAFLLRARTWEDGTEVAPVDQDVESPIREAFTRAVHGKSVTAIESYWQRLVYLGRGAPPPAVSSDEEVLAFLDEDRGSVGYVSATMPLDSRFRVLDVPDLEGYDVAALSGGGPATATLEDVTVGRHGDLRLFLTGSCGPEDQGRQAVLENAHPLDRLEATIETSIWVDGWFRASSAGRHALAPLTEERLGCTHESGGRERRHAIVEVSSAATHRRESTDLAGGRPGHDGPAREAVAIVGAGTCGSGRRGETRSVINRHPWQPISVAVETREKVGDTVKRRYQKTYRLSPGDSRRLGCSADGNLERSFTLLEAKYR